MYAINDLVASVRNWRALAYWAAKKIQLESRRTHLGIFWVVLSFGISATGIAVVISELTGRALVVHVPYVLFGFAAWNFIANAITSGCGVFVSNRGMLLQLYMPRYSLVFTLLFRHLYIFGINLGVAAIVAALFGWRPTMMTWQFVPAVLVFFFSGLGAITVLGVISTWMRDVTEVVNAVMRLAFFFTPVIWIYEVRSQRLVSGTLDADVSTSLMGWLTTNNPFSHFLAIMRDPLLGQSPSLEHWLVSTGLCLGLLVFALVLIQVGGRRIAYWL